MSASTVSFREKIARAGAMAVMPFALAGAIIRNGREGVADSRIATIAMNRVADLVHPENASGPVAVAGSIGYYVAGFPGALAAGLCTSLGCAIMSRMVPEHKYPKKPKSEGTA